MVVWYGCKYISFYDFRLGWLSGCNFGKKKNNNYVRQASGHHCMPRWLHVNVVINGSDFHIFNGRSMACKIAQYFRAVRNPIQKGGLVQGSNRMELRG